ncbi:MAG: hypothetical protein R6U67_11910 [Sodalinema sp.]
MAEAVARALGGSAAGWRQNQLAEYSFNNIDILLKLNYHKSQN